MEKIIFYKPVIDLKATGAEIRKVRKLNGLSIRDIQEVFGFEYPQAIYLWEQGKNIPSIDNLLILAKLFKVNISSLIVSREVAVEIECSSSVAVKVCAKKCETCKYKLTA